MEIVMIAHPFMFVFGLLLMACKLSYDGNHGKITYRWPFVIGGALLMFNSFA